MYKYKSQALPMHLKKHLKHHNRCGTDILHSPFFILFGINAPDLVREHNCSTFYLEQ